MSNELGLTPRILSPWHRGIGTTEREDEFMRKAYALV